MGKEHVERGPTALTLRRAFLLGFVVRKRHGNGSRIDRAFFNSAIAEVVRNAAIDQNVQLAQHADDPKKTALVKRNFKERRKAFSDPDLLWKMFAELCSYPSDISFILLPDRESDLVMTRHWKKCWGIDRRIREATGSDIWPFSTRRPRD